MLKNLKTLTYQNTPDNRVHHDASSQSRIFRVNFEKKSFWFNIFLFGVKGESQSKMKRLNLETGFGKSQFSAYTSH